MFASALVRPARRELRLEPDYAVGSYRGLADPDLLAIFSYLRTMPAVHHRVDNAQDPTECRLCNAKHGAGAEN